MSFSPCSVPCWAVLHGWHGNPPTKISCWGNCSAGISLISPSIRLICGKLSLNVCAANLSISLPHMVLNPLMLNANSKPPIPVNMLNIRVSLSLSLAHYRYLSWSVFTLPSHSFFFLAFLFNSNALNCAL